MHVCASFFAAVAGGLRAFFSMQPDEIQLEVSFAKFNFEGNNGFCPTLSFFSSFIEALIVSPIDEYCCREYFRFLAFPIYA